MLNKFQKFGKDAEKLAEKTLKKNGYRIVEKNFRSPDGEIDIIAKEKDVTVFVEVKARTSEKYGHPKEAVSLAKQKKIARVAQYYLKKKGVPDGRSRFDVVSIQLIQGSLTVEITRNAFEYMY